MVPNTGHVCAPLLGRFKSEYGEQKHMLRMVNVSKSGIDFWQWLEWLVFVLQKEERHKVAGPAFCHPDGSMLDSKYFNQELIILLERLKFEHSHLFDGMEDVGRDYGVSWSFRRGANLRATEEGVSDKVCNLVNRWSSFEAKKGKRPNMSMAQRYLEAKLIIKRTLVYSRLL